MVSLRKGSSLANVTAIWHKQPLPGHLTPDQDRRQVSRPPGPAQVGEKDRLMERGRKGSCVTERWGEKEDEELLWDHWPNHGAPSAFLLCAPLHWGPCPSHCQTSLFYKTKWTACSLLQGNILAVTFKSTIFYRHNYHSPFASMQLVGVLTQVTLPGQLKMAKDKLTWGEKAEIATSDTSSIPPLF